MNTDNLPELNGTEDVNSSATPFTDSVVQQEETPFATIKEINKKQPRRKFPLVGGVLLLMALLVGAIGVGVYIYSKYPGLAKKNQVEVQPVAETQPETQHPSLPLSSDPYSGLYGASAVEMQMNFTTGEGCRFYRADPYNKFALRLTDVTPVGNDAYEVEITEFIEGRIKVGVYKGIITDSEFRGEYVSTHGDRREFHLTR